MPNTHNDAVNELAVDTIIDLEVGGIRRLAI